MTDEEMTKDELQEIADMYGLYTEQDVENHLSCRLLSIGARNEELEKENTDLKKHNKELIALIKAERERQEKCDDIHLRTIAEMEKENAELKRHIKADCIDCVDYCKNKRLEKENEELKEKLAGAERTRDNLIQLGFPTFQSCKEYADKMNYAKAIIKDLLDNSDEYARQRAMDFLNLDINAKEKLIIKV